MNFQINVTIKTKDAKAIDIDREIRMLMRDYLETATKDVLNNVPFDYRYENELVKLRITNKVK